MTEKQFFNDKKCTCGSDDIAIVVRHPNVLSNDDYPIDTECFLGCRSCARWQIMKTTTEIRDVWDTSAWEIQEQGKGTYSSEIERRKTLVYVKVKS